MTSDAPRVLLAEDDAALILIVEGLLEDAGLSVETAPDGLQALAAYERASAAGHAPAVVVSDINMPGLDGLELIDRLKALNPEVLVIFITAYSSVDGAVAALRKGAYDYVTKPFRNDHLVQTVKNAVRQAQLFRENRTLRREIEQTYGFQEIVGRSPGMQAVFRVLERAAPTQASILIRGETGTGKELVARAIHHASPRSGQPFVSLNCAALPEGLLESELFGHEKGAFTGAVKASLGLFRAASGGTLFLDEVGEMSAALQAKLLRVLETRDVRPVGATESIPVDVRIVAATHRDLLPEADAEPDSSLPAFREDLFYRLAVIEVDVPPLRQRPGDVPLIAQHVLRKIAADRNEPERGLAPEVTELFRGYAWPGNVRELLNALEHAVTLGSHVVTVDDLPARIRRAPRAAPAALPDGAPLATLAEVERDHVERALAAVGGDRKRAADALGIDPSTLYRKLKRWGL